MLATSFAEAAGVAGRQKWSLVFSSSARVSQITYQTVVGVRYPEPQLVTFNGTSWFDILHEYQEESRWLENSYKDRTGVGSNSSGNVARPSLQGKAVAQSPSQWVSTVYLHRLDQIDALSWQWIDHHENVIEQVWHTQQGVFRRKRPPDV